MKEKEIKIEYIDPLTDKEKELLHNCRIEHLTKKEVISKYGYMLTEKQLRILNK